MDEVLEKEVMPLSVEEVKKELEKDIILLDTRQPYVFTQGFIPASVNIGLDGKFAEWAESLLPQDKPIIIVSEPGSEKKSVLQLAQSGISQVIGYADGGVDAWRAAGEPLDLIIDVETDELAMDIPFDENLVVVDVRQPNEFARGHVKDALNIPLNELNDPAIIASFEETQNLYICSGSGYRSVVAASLLKRQGIHNIRNILGGWDQIKEQEKIKTEKDTSILN